MKRARDAVSHLQSECGLTLGSLAERVMKRQIRAARRRIGGDIPTRPEGQAAGVRGRRKGAQAIERTTYSVKVPEELREKWRDLAYMNREKKELAEFFEDGLDRELKYLAKAYGEIPPRSSGLKPGRKVR